MGTNDPDTNTDSVVVSDGNDKKISLWRKTGQSTGTIPAVGTDSGGDNIENGYLKEIAIKTPYLPDGRFDLEAYDSLVNMQIEDGTDGVIVGGTLKFGKIQPHGVAIKTRKGFNAYRFSLHRRHSVSDHGSVFTGYFVQNPVGNIASVWNMVSGKGTLKFGSLDLDVATRPQNAEGFSVSKDFNENYISDLYSISRFEFLCHVNVHRCTKRLDWTLLSWLDMSRKVVFLKIGMPKVQRYSDLGGIEIILFNSGVDVDTLGLTGHEVTPSITPLNHQVKMTMATNRPHVLDPTLPHSGRLDGKIEIPLPNEQSRMEILKIDVVGIAKHGEIDYEAVYSSSLTI
ncbi:26S protease regulatory subunit S10B-B-like protein [Tanacetum coccineum]